jgi:hypothetical protein
MHNHLVEPGVEGRKVTSHFTTYYPQGNGKVKSTNKFIINFIPKLVSENKANWGEHLTIVFFFYMVIYKVAIRYTPYIVESTFVNAHKICYVNNYWLQICIPS